MEKITNNKEKKQEQINKETKEVKKMDSKKDKIKKFIEKGKKDKKILYKDIVKFVDDANITPEEMAKIYDNLAELNLNIIMDDVRENSKEEKPYTFDIFLVLQFIDEASQEILNILNKK